MITGRIRWEYEDQLPAMDAPAFDDIFRASQIRSGVRMYPYVETSEGDRVYVLEPVQPYHHDARRAALWGQHVNEHGVLITEVICLETDFRCISNEYSAGTFTEASLDRILDEMRSAVADLKPTETRPGAALGREGDTVIPGNPRNGLPPIVLRVLRDDTIPAFGAWCAGSALPEQRKNDALR